ncbi:MAG: DNA repair protein RecN [Dehalococcoidia bacterium]|nr:DNA repair protein RecN [Dehalococcoidia bacterium]
MLERLAITGFAVARSVVVEPGPGLNVFTGETGAGKSLVVDALAFALGARRGREVIASGAGHATVEATLSLDGARVVVERTVGLSGRTSVRINGAVATLDDARALASRAADIHGQSEQLAILRPAVQLEVLDSFGGLAGERRAVAQAVRELRDVWRRLHALATDARERERLIEQLRFEAGEIAAAALSPGEDEALRQERSRLADAGRLTEDVEAALGALDASEAGEAVRAVADIAARDTTAGELADLGLLLESTVTDLARALRRYRDGIEHDPGRLTEVEERLDLIARLRRKYGETVPEIIAYGREAEARLAELAAGEERIEDLAACETELLAGLAADATRLSLSRRQAAAALVQALGVELERLGMGGARLAVGFSCDDDPGGPAVALPDYELVAAGEAPGGPAEPFARAISETGVDRVEFLASFNAGEARRPLAAVASGGETSRFLLALTTVLGASAEPRTVVLDEVDEGVGGRAGALVGEALSRLAERHQVLCVTHLPQVAAFASRHFVVSKQSDGARTWSEISEVTGDDRVRELASMLGGPGEANQAVARELLAAAGERDAARLTAPG